MRINKEFALYFTARIIPAAGLFLINYYVGITSPAQEASEFMLDLLALNIISLITCGGANISILKSKDSAIHQQLLYVISNIAIAAPIVFAAAKVFNLSWLVYCYAFQTLSLFLSSALKSKKLFSAGALTEYGLASFLVFLVAATTKASLEQIKLLLFLAFLITNGIQLYLTLKNTLPPKTEFKYSHCFLNGYTYALTGVYSLINVWAITFYISKDSAFFVEYNITVRAVMFLSFIVASIDSISMVRFSEWLRNGAIQTAKTNLSSYRKKIFPTALLLFASSIILALILAKSASARAYGINFILIPILSIQYLSYFFFGPVGSYLLALGGEKINHNANLSISILQIFTILIASAALNFDTIVAYSILAAFQLCTTIKFWIYHKWSKKRELQF